MWKLQRYQENTCIIDEVGRSLSYGDLQGECDKLIEVLGGRCLAFVLCTNTTGSLLGYVSCINGNVVPLLLNAHLEQGLLTNLLEVYRPKFVWAPADTDSLTDFEKVYSAFGYSLYRTDFEEEYDLHEDLALLLTTSGSTGSPKFVRQSYDNLRANTDSIVKYLELDSTERAITTLPMNYTYGLSIINTHLDVGATLLLTDKGLMQKEFWIFFKEQRATSFGGVPYTYEMLDRLRFTRMDLPDLRTMTQAGGKITPELHKRFAEFAKQNGKKFVVMYGQCEATARMGYLPPDKAVEKCGSMGIVIPGGRFQLIDVKGEEINTPHTTGELVYEGKNVTMGYAECGEDLAKGDERGGTLETGDMAQFDEDGYYYIVGRKKRFLKIYGNRVNLDEVDRMIKGGFPELDVASSGVDDHMFIFVNAESKLQEIKDFISHKTGLNPAAFQMKYISEIPKNDAGKVVYKDLEQYYEDEK